MKIPKNFGRYEVLDLISQGGMGTLFRARDPRIGRYVAVKVLKRSFDTEELRDRFSREARAAGCLSHPNIVTIYDVGEQDGLPFIAMEYVRGETFIELVGLKPPLPVDRKLQLMEEVCAGLAHAHEAGIVHRDIKPANLILSSEGTVKILDFGIAKLSSANMTIPGAIMGTLNYMSPEQAKGNPVDARTDVFAVGVVMYELLSHQPAFTGTYATEALHKILHGSPTPITEYCPGLDPRLVDLIDRAIEKDPDKRFQTIAAVGKAISSIRLDSLRVTRSAPRATPRPAQRTTDPATIRSEQIEDLLAAAERAFDSGDYDGATDACKQVLLLDATNARALAELDRVQAALDERHAEVRAAVERGRAALASGNLMSALREVKQAQALDPNDPEALALSALTEQASRERQEDARIRAAVGAARRQFAAGEHRAALAALQALQPASHPLVRPALDELRTALDQIDEQQRIETELQEQRRQIAALASQAAAAIAANRLDDGARIVSQIRRHDPAAPEIADLTERIRQAEAAARTRAELDRAFAEFEARLAEEDLSRAEASLTAAAALASHDTRLAAARQRLDAAQAAAAARAAAEARRRECEQTLDAAVGRIEVGDLAAAGEMVKRAAELVPDHPRIVQVSEALRLALERQAAAEAAERLRREVEALVRSASAHLDASADNATGLSAALADVTRALELDPSSADAATVKSAIDAAIAARREAARVRAAIDNAGRRFANGKHHAAIKLLEDFDPPDQPDIVRALGQLRTALQVIEEKRRAEQERIERQQRAAALVNGARTALQERRFDDALQMLASAEEVEATAADVAALRAEVIREQAVARQRAEIDAIVAQLDDQLSGGDLDAARELLTSATALSATDEAVVGARQRVNHAIAQREAAAREAAAAREREEAAARERAAREAREREEAAAREKAAREAREREEAAAREKAAREAREREEAAAREKAAREAREREEAAAREKAAREAREREEAAAREKAAREAREREAAAARERAVREARVREEEAAARARIAREAEARAKSAREREEEVDPGAETIFSGDLQEAVRAAREAAARERGGTAPAPAAQPTPTAMPVVTPARPPASHPAPSIVASQPATELAEVRLGVSAPRAATRGEVFTARFVAYGQAREAIVTRRLSELDPPRTSARQISTGLTPTGSSRWRIDAPVLVHVYGRHLTVTPAAQAFEWNGEENLVSFLVTVDADAPDTVTHLCFEATIEGVPVFFMPVDLRIGAAASESETRFVDAAPIAKAFASYASKDRAVVTQCLSALKHWDPGIDVFIDCLDLTPNERWQRELERVIPAQDAFLLFWSTNAMASASVAWEMSVAETSRNIDYIRPMPLESPDIAPPPEKLKHLHFGDRYLYARQDTGFTHGRAMPADRAGEPVPDEFLRRAVREAREAVRDHETGATREAKTAPVPGVTNDHTAETLFAGDLQEAVRAALAASGRESPVPPPPPAPVPVPPPAAETADADRARRNADELLAAARKKLRVPSPQMADVTSALEHIEQALAVVPNDTEALALETTANETLARLREAAKIDAAIRNARSRFAIGKHHAAIQLLEGLDPAANPAVAAALKELRAQIQAIEDQRRQAEAARQKPRAVPDDDATRVILLPDVLAQMQAEAAAKAQPDAGGATMISNGAELPRGSVAAPAPVQAREVPASPQSTGDSQKRLIVLAGVLFFLLIFALALLRFAS